MRNCFNHCFSKLSFFLLYFPTIFIVKIFKSKEELKKRVQQTSIYSLLRFTNCNILLQNSLINILSDVPTFCLLPSCPISPFLLSPLYAFYTYTILLNHLKTAANFDTSSHYLSMNLRTRIFSFITTISLTYSRV